MSASAFNPYNQSQSMSQYSRHNNNLIGSFYGQSPKHTRTVQNDATGKPFDKLTADQTHHQGDPHLSIYNQDFGGKVGNTKHKNNQPKSNGHANKKNLPALKNNAPTTSQPNHNAQNQAQTERQEHRHPIQVIDNQSADPKPKATGPKVTVDETRNNFMGTSGSEARHTKTYSTHDIECVHTDVKRSYSQNPNIKHDEEAEYYETVRRLDVCGHCWTDQRKYCTGAFNPMHKSPALSLYQKDYVKHPLQEGPVMKNDFYGTFNIPEPIDFGTTMKNDYKPWNAKAPERPKPTDKSAASGVPFGGKSGYKGDYINWGNMPVNYEKAPQNLTTIKELPFMSKTSYQDNFGKPNTGDQVAPLDRDLWNKKKKSPISSGIPFLGLTTHGQTYKPYKVGGAPMFNYKEEYEPTEAYPDQFRSTYAKDFAKQDKWKCPARIFMDTHPNPRVKTVKA